MHTFGYYISPGVQLDAFHRHLINLGQSDKSQKYIKVSLRDTKLRLLMFLLEHAGEKLITNQKIMTNVWEHYGLRASSARLWQVMQDLKSTLISVGVDFDALITKVDSRGYSVNGSMVIALYCKKNHLDSVWGELEHAC